jgi:flagellar motor switch protein FliN/FliY
MIWEIGVNVTPSAPILLHVLKVDSASLGNRILSAAGLDDSDDQTIQDTFKEAIDQAFGGLAREMTGKLGKEVNAASSKVTSGGVAGKVSWTKLELVFGDNKPASVSVGFIDELVQKLVSKSTAPASTSAPAAAAATSAAASGGGGQPESRTLDLLLDVELPISVSFGRAHLPLKEVMKLTTGSIVELNRTISEPVDIIVNNCVIARGEVVVVEGNFGVRIQEVISRQERLRTLY